jgi:hypothetical protein
VNDPDPAGSAVLGNLVTFKLRPRPVSPFSTLHVRLGGNRALGGI